MLTGTRNSTTIDRSIALVSIPIPISISPGLRRRLDSTYGSSPPFTYRSIHATISARAWRTDSRAT